MVANPLRVVFFGTPEFAVPTLDALLSSTHHVVGVVTQPDRPRGRGQRTSPSPVKARALAARTVVFQPDRLGDPPFLDALTALHTDIGVVAAYGKILPVSVLSAPRLGMINVHASLLPRYRGAAPVHRAVIAGEQLTGVTIMRIVKALDAGPVLAATERAIGADETSVDVERDLARLGAGLLVTTLNRLSSGPVHETPQDESRATYASRLTKEDGAVDWSTPADAVHNLIRGLHPWPHAFTFLQGRRYILLRSAVASGTGRPGEVVEATADRLIVATGAGAVRLLEIQPEGKRPMNAREFLAGHRLGTGDIFRAA
jgi:methionyl-tRNA formyltransferase